MDEAPDGERRRWNGSGAGTGTLNSTVESKIYDLSNFVSAGQRRDSQMEPNVVNSVREIRILNHDLFACQHLIYV